MKYFIGEEGGTGREFNTFSDFMDAISDIASAYEENGEDYFEIKVESKCKGVQVLHCGTFKTLGTSLEYMRIMGELAGSLIFFAKEYIYKNIEKYTPQKERKI